jgi:hypothetical protein
MTDRRRASRSHGRAPSRALRPVVEGVERRVLLSSTPQTAVVAGPPVDRSVGRRLVFAYNAYEQGKAMSHSHDVRYVGAHYARLTVASDTRKVAYAYLHAALRGDGKTLSNLGHTRLVQKVGHDFSKLSNSQRVQKVGDAFSSFGKAVAKRFDSLFGKTDPPSKTK